jgi:hypothetical protein
MWLNLLPKWMGTLLIALWLSKWPTYAKVPHVKAKWHNFLKIAADCKITYIVRHGGQSSIAGQCMWHLWWTKWHRYRFFSGISVFPVRVTPPILCSHPFIASTTQSAQLSASLNRHCSFIPVQYNLTCPFVLQHGLLYRRRQCAAAEGNSVSSLATLLHSYKVSFSKNPHGNN